MNRKQILIVSALAMGLVTKPALAVDTSFGAVNLWQQLAAKLGIPQSKVQTAFEDLKKDRQDQAQKVYESRLNELVTQKKITEQQKALILAKHKEMQDKMNAWNQDRQTYMQGLSDWASKNGIDMSYVGGDRGGMMKRDFGDGNKIGMMGRGMMR